MTRPPTERQAQVLALLRAGVACGHPPSLREIGGRMGIASANGVTDHLKALERKGLVERVPGQRSRCSWVPLPDRPVVSSAWLRLEAIRLWHAIDDTWGGASMSDGPGWWLLVVRTGGWSANEAAIASVDATWHALTHQATIRGGLHVWAWGPVPEELGGELGPVRVVG